MNASVALIAALSTGSRCDPVAYSYSRALKRAAVESSAATSHGTQSLFTEIASECNNGAPRTGRERRGRVAFGAGRAPVSVDVRAQG